MRARASEGQARRLASADAARHGGCVCGGRLRRGVCAHKARGCARVPARVCVLQPQGARAATREGAERAVPERVPERHGAPSRAPRGGARSCRGVGARGHAARRRGAWRMPRLAQRHDPGGMGGVLVRFLPLHRYAGCLHRLPRVVFPCCFEPPLLRVEGRRVRPPAPRGDLGHVAQRKLWARRRPRGGLLRRVQLRVRVEGRRVHRLHVRRRAEGHVGQRALRLLRQRVRMRAEG